MNKVEKVYPTIEEVWEYVKRNFRKGKDYIETETDEYIVFCPFNYCVLSFFDDAFRHFDTPFYFQHCVAQSFGAFGFWYSMIYRDGMLKTFFIRKDINLGKNCGYYKENGDFLVEFTGWIDFNDRHFLHFAHLVNNDFVTGCLQDALSRVVRKDKKDLVDKMNYITSEVYDDLFAQYDAHISELEETLHNILNK